MVRSALAWTPSDSSMSCRGCSRTTRAQSIPRTGASRRSSPSVGGLARENNLALLQLAASLLGKGESYVEVGSFKGLSLIAAMLGNAGDFVGIDNFSLGDGNRAQLETNLRRYGLRWPHPPGGRRLRAPARRRAGGPARGRLLLRRRARLPVPGPGSPADRALSRRRRPPDRRRHRLGAGRPRDARLPRRPAEGGASPTLDGKDRGQPWWWEGVQVLRWRAGPSSAPPRPKPRTRAGRPESR